MTEATAADGVRRWGVRVRGPHRAIPARAPRPLLPDARLVRRGRGRGPGDVPAGVAGARDVRRQLAGPRLAVQDRHERLPRRAPADRAAPDARPHVRRGAVADALPRPPARRDRAGRRRARRRRRRRARPSSSRSSPRSRSCRRASGRRSSRATSSAGRRPRRRRRSRPPSPAVNSALQRARATMQAHLPGAPVRLVGGRAERRGTRPARQASSRRTSAATPPSPCRSRPRTCASRCRRPRCCSRASRSSRRCSRTRSAKATGACCRPIANRMPTAASYLRAPGDTIYRAFKFDVLRVVDGQIAEITTFGPALFPQFGLPPTL